jgi:hypothetical protein
MTPRVSIISVLFNSDQFLPRFFRNITSQTCFEECELICFIPAAASAAASTTVREFQQRFGARVRDVRVGEDPGLYALWNQGIGMARGEFISNANPDDLRAPRHIAACIDALDQRPRFDVCASRIGYTDDPQANWTDGSQPAEWIAELSGEFGAADLFTMDTRTCLPVASRNIPHCMPVWRKSLHERFGWFDEERFGPSADWEFWLRCLSGGARGWLLEEVLGLYLLNPESYWRANQRAKEFDAGILEKYRELAAARNLRRAAASAAPITGLLHRANELVRSGELALACDLYQEYCKRHPRFAPAWTNYLLCLARLNRSDDFKQALGDMNAAFATDPLPIERLQLLCSQPWRQFVEEALTRTANLGSGSRGRPSWWR